MGIDAMMFVRTKTKITPDDLRRLSFRMCSALGAENFFHGYPPNCHALEFCKIWEQDGPDINSENGETFVDVHLYTRYYGPGYERGDFPLIAATAEWLERNIKGSEVWYGGDSSGVCAKKFDKKVREEFWKHFCGEHGADYRTDRESGPECRLCLENMTRYMWSGDSGGGYCCHGCGQKLETRDGGKTYFEPTGRTG